MLISKVIHMRVNGTMIYKMEKEKKNMLMAHYLKERMLMERNMEKDVLFIKMAQNIVDRYKKIRYVDKEQWNFLMEKYM